MRVLAVYAILTAIMPAQVTNLGGGAPVIGGLAYPRLTVPPALSGSNWTYEQKSVTPIGYTVAAVQWIGFNDPAIALPGGIVLHTEPSVITLQLVVGGGSGCLGALLCDSSATLAIPQGAAGTELYIQAASACVSPCSSLDLMVSDGFRIVVQ